MVTFNRAIFVQPIEQSLPILRILAAIGQDENEQRGYEGQQVATDHPIQDQNPI